MEIAKYITNKGTQIAVNSINVDGVTKYETTVTRGDIGFVSYRGADMERANRAYRENVQISTDYDKD